MECFGGMKSLSGQAVILKGDGRILQSKHVKATSKGRRDEVLFLILVLNGARDQYSN